MHVVVSAHNTSIQTPKNQAFTRSQVFASQQTTSNLNLQSLVQVQEQIKPFRSLPIDNVAGALLTLLLLWVLGACLKSATILITSKGIEVEALGEARVLGFQPHEGAPHLTTTLITLKAVASFRDFPMKFSFTLYT